MCSGKTCILFDDMVDTAGSLCNAAKAIVEDRRRDQASTPARPTACSPARPIERVADSCIKELILLNTIPLPEARRQQDPPAGCFPASSPRPSSEFIEENSISVLF